MKRLFAVTCLSVTMGWAAVAVGQTVRTVDVRQIFQASLQVKDINIRLEREFLPQRKRIISLGKSLQEDAKKLQRNEVIMSKKEAEDLRNKIQKEQKGLQREQIEFQQELYEAQSKAMGEFMTKISGAVRAVAEKEKVDLVLPKNTVLYARDAKDITSEVISALK